MQCNAWCWFNRFGSFFCLIFYFGSISIPFDSAMIMIKAKTKPNQTKIHIKSGPNLSDDSVVFFIIDWLIDWCCYIILLVISFKFSAKLNVRFVRAYNFFFFGRYRCQMVGWCVVLSLLPLPIRFLFFFSLLVFTSSVFVPLFEGYWPVFRLTAFLHQVRLDSLQPMPYRQVDLLLMRLLMSTKMV